MQYFLAIGYTGLVALLQYPLRSLATIGCVVAVLLPYLAGIGLSQGIQEQADEAIRFGADLYVNGQQFGREAPMPVDLADRIRQIDGVTAVVPRIVARMVLGKNREEAVLVGLPLDHFPAGVTCVEGRLPRPSRVNELVVGSALAKRLALHVGSLIPPFYHSSGGDKVSQVVGIFKSDVSLWEANLVLTSFATASAICNQEGLATDLLVYCRAGYRDGVRSAILRGQPLPAPQADSGITLEVTGRDDVQALLPAGLLHREGIFNLHFLVAFAVAILTILVTSGFGSSERRREIGILKATGWQTDELLLRGVVESFLLALAGAALSVVLAFVWLRLLNGYWIASIFLPGVGVRPGFPVPFRLTPVPALLSFLLAVVLVLSGSVYATWRAAVVPPREAMR
jgi:ABC-type lipoprotein release transport system permease subunit